MAGKKSAGKGGKKDKGKGKGKGGAALSPEEAKLKAAEAEIRILHNVMVQRNQLETDAMQREATALAEADRLREELRQHKEDSRDIAGALLQQVKSQQQQLVARLEGLEKERGELKKQLEVANETIDQERKSKAQMKAALEKEVADYRRRLVDFSSQFSSMLKGTLDNVQEKLEAKAASAQI